MVNYYMELPIFDAGVDRPYKYAVYNQPDGELNSAAAYRARRIWKDDGEEVTWYKNRLGGNDAEMDKNEFLLVQLKAVPNRRANLKL
jgi:hypothetical protein